MLKKINWNCIRTGLENYGYKRNKKKKSSMKNYKYYYYNKRIEFMSNHDKFCDGTEFYATNLYFLILKSLQYDSVKANTYT